MQWERKRGEREGYCIFTECFMALDNRNRDIIQFLIRYGSSGLPEGALARDCFKRSRCHWAVWKLRVMDRDTQLPIGTKLEIWT